MLTEYNIRMLTLFCGDHMVASRTQFIDYRKRLDQQGVECIDATSSDISGIQSQVYGSSSLFSTKQAFFAQNIFSKKTTRDALKDIIADPMVELVVWEEKMEERELKRYFPKSKLIVNKLPTTIWKFLDAFYPGNPASLIRQQALVGDTVDENMLLYMLQRRVKDLILVSKGLDGKRKLAPWQSGIMKAQAARWGTTQEERLAKLHKTNSKLYSIEVGTKTSRLPYPIHKALDILFSFYLQ